MSVKDLSASRPAADGSVLLPVRKSLYSVEFKPKRARVTQQRLMVARDMQELTALVGLYGVQTFVAEKIADRVFA
jgi:hypothetical protein